MKVAGTAAVLAQRYDKTCRADREYRADHDKQDDREHAHDVLHRVAEVLARDLRDGRAVVDADRRGFPVVRTEGVVHNFTVGQITCDKKCQTYDEADHKTPLLETEHMKMDSLTAIPHNWTRAICE